MTVLKSILLKERAHELGARLLKRSAGNTNTYAGDGTTSSSVLSREIIDRGIKAIEFEEAHPVGIKRGLAKAHQVVSQFLNEIAMPVTTADEILNVSRVSSNYDDHIS